MRPIPRAGTVTVTAFTLAALLTGCATGIRAGATAAVGDVAAPSATPTNTAVPLGTPMAASVAVPVPAAATTAAATVPCAPSAAACVSLSEQEAWFLRDGKVLIGPVGVATGRDGYRTETGTFRVYRKNRMWYSTVYDNAPMPYSVFFNGGDAFHQGPLTIMSHGCVHLGPGTAAAVFAFLRIGDEVQVVR